MMNYLEKKKKAMMNSVASGGRLPSEYQEVEWIESSGTQYINTGYNPSSSTCIEVTVNIPSYQNDAEIYGARSGGRYYENTFGGKKFLYVQMKNTPNVPYTDWNITHTFSIINGDFYIDDTLKITAQQTLGGDTYQITVPLYLFALDNGNNPSRFIKQKMYYCKLEENNQTQREFIPCYRKSDDVIGMYDLANDTFYTNSGSGTFTKGNDV